ncbi:MAG: bifunctional DNA primase/polymerase [Paracoccaceae bacterium]
MTKAANLKAALTLASQGFAIFPADPAAKTPMPGCRWKDEASNDPATIKQWWKKWPEAMPAVPTGKRNGFSVVDLDQRDGKDGEATYRALGLDPEAAALIVRTGGGGLHLYFDHADGVRNTQGDKGRPGLDIRGEGGYVIAPGAVSAGGSYTILKGRLDDSTGYVGLGPFPAALRRAKVERVQEEPTGPIDWPALKAALFSIPNDTGYGEWVSVLMGLHHASQGSQMGLDLARAWSSDYPGYSRAELAEKWLSFGKNPDRDTITAATIFDLARQYGQAAITADDFDDDDDDTAAEDTAGLSFLSPADCAALAPADYIVKGLIAPGQVGCIFGEPGAGKSVVAPRLAYAIAQGDSIFGLRTRQGGVFYVACEDESGMAGRVTALHSELGEAEGFRLVRGCADLFSPGQVKGKGSPHLQALRRAVKAAKPRLVVIDTLAMAMPGMEENDAAGMARVVSIGRALARWGAAVIFIHHGTKAEGSTPRGHSVFNGALDFSIQVKPVDQNGIARGVIRKNRNGPPDLDIAFRIGSREVGRDVDNEPVTAPICEPCTAIEAQPMNRLSPAQLAALDLLDRMADKSGQIAESDWRAAAIEGGEVSASENRDNRRRAVTRALQDLIRLKLVVVSEGQLSRGYRAVPDSWFDDDTGGKCPKARESGGDYADLI